MIVLFTDYGYAGPYLGQLHAVLHQEAPGVPIVNLCADAPRQNPRAAAYLLAAWTSLLPSEIVNLCVVDPGVGSWQDPPVVMNLDGRWYVGPDNGLFDVVGRRARHRACWDITWRPLSLSASFHGRDLYAPVAAMLVNRSRVPGTLRDWQPRLELPDELAEIVYIDGFGNVMTGLHKGHLHRHQTLAVAGQSVIYAETFATVPAGTAFWYENSSGLIEIAVNCGSASQLFGVKVGDKVVVS